MRHNSAAIGFSPNTSTLKGKNEVIHYICITSIFYLNHSINQTFL